MRKGGFHPAGGTKSTVVISLPAATPPSPPQRLMDVIKHNWQFLFPSNSVLKLEARFKVLSMFLDWKLAVSSWIWPLKLCLCPGALGKA